MGLVDKVERNKETVFGEPENFFVITNNSRPFGSSAWNVLCRVKCFFFNAKSSTSLVSVKTE